MGKVHAYNGGGLGAFLAPLDALFVRLAYRIDSQFLDMAPRLRWLCSPTTGNNHIDEKVLADRGVRLINLRGERMFLDTIRATPEHTFGLVLAVLRRYGPAFSRITSTDWNRDACRGEELFGNTVGIIGLGRVGYRVATYCSAFGANVVWCDQADVPSEPEWVRLADILSVISESRVVVLCASYSFGQFPLLGEREIMALSGRYFVNTSRGELVDEPLLLAALREKLLAGAAVDVISDETHNNRLHEWHALLPHTNLIITPHIGGATFESMARTEIFIAKKLKALAQDNEAL